MGKPSAPAAPDPVRTAQAQTASNKETAIAQTGLNAINQVTPQGSLSYSQNGTWADGTPRFTATTTLSPEQQKLYNTGLATQQNLATLGNQQSQAIGKLMSTPFNTDGLPSAGNANITAPTYQQYGSGPAFATTYDQGGAIQKTLGTDDFSADRQKVEDALMARLNPQIERDRAAQEASLANRGIRMGSDNYNVAQDQFARNVNDARLGAIINAGDEQTRMQNMALNAGNFANAAQAQQNSQNAAAANFGNAAKQQEFANQTSVTAANNALGDQRFANAQAQFNLNNTARNQALNERLTTRNQALNENIGLATGSQITMPQFNNTPQTGMAGTDVAGITQGAYNGALNAYGQQMGQWNNTMGGLFGLGSSLIMASDKKLKKNIHATGEKVAGVPVKEFEWRDSGRQDQGVIAQDVEKRYPHLVEMAPDGYRRVDYGNLIKLGAMIDAKKKRSA